MSSKDCIFCKIINGEMKSNIIFENDVVIAFPDINPVADTHILIVPKRHIESVATIGAKDGKDLTLMFETASKLAADKKLEAYRVSFNAGKFQHVPHLHMHLLAGSKIEWSKL